jgi:hypothetical protein
MDNYPLGVNMKAIQKFLTISSILLFMLAPFSFAGSKDPVAILSQAEGKVEYSKDGKEWKEVKRNKFLFPGTMIRTGGDGKGKVTNKISGDSFDLGGDTEFSVDDKGINTKKGKLAKAEASSQLAANLMKKFDNSQSYTTVRRSHSVKEIKIDAARELVVYSNFPYVVWESVGSEYNYKLIVGKKTYDVAASKDDIIRAKIDGFTGTQTYRIDVYKGSKKEMEMEPFKQKGETAERTITWLEGAEQKKVDDSIAALQQEYPDNLFMMGNYYEDQGLYVAAMDQYRKYLKDNPDEVEMAPYLFRVYKKLKLEKVYKTELEAYKAQLLE